MYSTRHIRHKVINYNTLSAIYFRGYFKDDASKVTSYFRERRLMFVIYFPVESDLYT